MRLRRKPLEMPEKPTKTQYVGSTRRTTISTGTIPLHDVEDDMTETAPPEKEFDDIKVENDVVNLIGDKDQVSDASQAIKALLGQGGDFRAFSEITQDEVRALLTLLDVAEELNSPRLLKTAENFLLLSISAGGKGRGQVVSAFKGLYEPHDPNDPRMQGMPPQGYLRGVR